MGRKEKRGVSKGRSPVGKRIKRKKKFQSIPPEFKLRVLAKKSEQYSVKDLQDLILYSLTGHNVEPRFAEIKNRRAIEKVVILQARGLERADMGISEGEEDNRVDPAKARDELKEVAKLFGHSLPLHVSGGTRSVAPFLTALSTMQLSKTEKKKLNAKFRQHDVSLDGLCIDLDTMLRNNYPIHPDTPGAKESLVKQYEGKYRPTTKFTHPGSKVFALDCEMCMAESGSVLTRASLLDWDGRVLIDELVKPAEPIVDYVTKYSGISEETLKDVTTTLKDVQDKILARVSSDDILIGHSLQSDLDALRISHPRVIDTSDCYDHPRGPPSKPSLKSLMLLHLNKAIHDREDGHDSNEDCECCLDLVKLKLDKGYGFGKNNSVASLFGRISTTNKLVLTDGGEKIPKSSFVIDYSSPQAFSSIEHRVEAHNDSETLAMLAEELPEHDLVFARLQSVELAKGWRASRDPDTEPQTEHEAYASLAEDLLKIWEMLPKNTVVVLSPGGGNLKQVIDLQKQRRKYQEEFRRDPTVKDHPTDFDWTYKKEGELAKAVEEARKSFFLIALKEGADDTVTI